MREAYRFGIEEEYFLADRTTGWSPPGAVLDGFHRDAARVVEAATHELLKGQIEVSTEPGIDAGIALATLRTYRRDLGRLAADRDLALFAAGSHPLGEARSQETTDEERYEHLESEFGIIARRSMCCAMHVHVEVPDGVQRIPVMNRMLPYLPIFYALSTSSPFWQGRCSGLRGFRLAAFSEWPRMGLPEIFENDADFERTVAALSAGNAIKDASFLWWLIRPSIHYPTIELRICDSCTRVEDAVVIASLYRCLVRCAVRRPNLNVGLGPFERTIAAENVWQAQRHGVAAMFVDAKRGAVSVADALNGLLDLVEEDADALGCAAEVASTRAMIRDGTSADRQLQTFRAAGSGAEALLKVVLALSEESTV